MGVLTEDELDQGCPTCPSPRMPVHSRATLRGVARMALRSGGQKKRSPPTSGRLLTTKAKVPRTISYPNLSWGPRTPTKQFAGALASAGTVLPTPELYDVAVLF